MDGWLGICNTYSVNSYGNKLDSKNDHFGSGLFTNDVINLKHQGACQKLMIGWHKHHGVSETPKNADVICEQPLICRWIPCYVFGDTLVVNIMGVTAVTSLLLRWWWWWLLSGVSATWGAIPRALSYAGVLRLWKLYFNMKHSWWEVGFMLRFELVWGYWNVLEFLMLMKAEISITILIGFFNLEVNQYCD